MNTPAQPTFGLPIKTHAITRYQNGEARQAEDELAVETVVTCFVGDQEIATLLCTPSDIESLAVGFLRGEGVLTRRDELLEVVYRPGRGTVHVRVTGQVDLSLFDGTRKGTLTSGCGKGQSYAFMRDIGDLPALPFGRRIAAEEISAKIRTFMHRSETYAATGGVHSAMLWDGAAVEVFAEDLGRHNAVDKVMGRCLMDGITTADRILLSSGRLSSEIVLKAARAQVPLVISRNAPTSFSVALADLLDITLVGFVRGSRMNVYSHPVRIT